MGFKIAKHLDLLEVCSNPEVYISRRALKHFVERRKDELIIRHSDFEALERIYFIINNLNLILESPDISAMPSHIRKIIIAEPKSGCIRTKEKTIKA